MNIYKGVGVLIVLFFVAIGDGIFSQGRDTTVSRTDFIKVLIDQRGELLKRRDEIDAEIKRIEGQVNLLQALRQDSVKLPKE